MFLTFLREFVLADCWFTIRSVGSGDDDCVGCEPVHGRSDERVVLGTDNADGRDDGPGGSSVAGDCDKLELTDNEG